MAISVGQAAKITGLSKPTITRAIKAGKVSATRNEDGSYSIDPSELARAYGLSADAVASGNASGDMTRLVAGERSTSNGGHGAKHDARNVPVTAETLQAEIEGLKAQLAMMREYTAQQIDELKHQRDAWQEQAQGAQRLLEHQAPRRGWFGLKRA